MKKHLFCSFLLLAFLAGHTQNIVFKKQLQPEKITNTNPAGFFIRGDKTQLLNYLKRIHGTYKYSFKNYHHITIPSNKIYELSQQPFVKYIDYHLQKPTALNDSMRVKARINQVHQGITPLPQGYTGKGVMIGFIDDGIDFNHPDFQDSSGNTRVLAIWDQSQPFDALRTPPAYGYGQVWDSTDINNGICTSMDASAGHGTTVAGTACGNGLSTGSHWGAAPNSWVVMVKTTYATPNWLGTVADAVDYMYKLADSLGMPCVINASVGDYYGSHDGRDIASQYIDSMIQAKRGRLMVAALGNSGTLPPYHLETSVDSDTSFTWFKYNAPGGGDAFPYGSVFFEAYADTADMKNVMFSMGADQISPVFKHAGQSTFRNAFDFLGVGITDTIFNSSGNILGIVDYYSEITGDVLVLQVHMQEPDSNGYYFRFSSTGSGTFDVWTGEWLGISDMINTGVPTIAAFPDIANYVSPDSAKTMVSAFQCLESVVSVANYNNIQNYVAYDLSNVVLGEIEGAIASTSSRGPTRDNRQKPDVAATGNVTFSPGPLATLALLISIAPFKLLPDGMHMRNGGTSMASPVVAGIGGLILERCPQINWLEFKTHINTSAYTDAFTGTPWNMTFGFGKVNAFEAIKQTVYAPLLSGDTVICADDVAQLLAPSDMQTYAWYNGDTTYASSTDTSGTFWFTGTDVAGCKTDTSYITILVNPLPTISISLDTGLFTASSPTAIIYQWYMNGIPISGANDSTYDALTNGDYFATAIDVNGCTATSVTLPFGGAGFDEIATNDVQIFPNPFNDNLTINTKNQSNVEIRNNLGQIIFSTSSSGTITTANWPTGMYYVIVRNEKGNRLFKMIKQ
jgi:hypothetical protein